MCVEAVKAWVVDEEEEEEDNGGDNDNDGEDDDSFVGMLQAHMRRSVTQSDQGLASW